jgi:peptide/nickel transport system permease protein
MLAYSVRRILTTIPLLLVALYMVHVGVSMTTDPLGSLRQCVPRCQDGYDRVVERYDLDKPVLVRPFTWFANAAQGDLGQSEAYTGRDVTDVLKSRGWNTMMIAVPAFLISAVLGVCLAVYSARRPYSKGDYFFTGVSFIGLALPTFVLGLILQNLLGVQLENWLGIKPFFTSTKHDESFGALLGSLALPVMTLAFVGIAEQSRYGRASMMEVVSSDYIRTARSKGLSERRVVWRHGLRNALIPMVTLWALAFSALLGGSVITESIFSWPGLGTAFLDGLGKPDLDLVMGITMFGAILAIAFNLIADLLYGVLDPRIRYD